MFLRMAVLTKQMYYYYAGQSSGQNGGDGSAPTPNSGDPQGPIGDPAIQGHQEPKYTTSERHSSAHMDVNPMIPGTEPHHCAIDA
jgi:hypothetical protein